MLDKQTPEAPEDGTCSRAAMRIWQRRGRSGRDPSVNGQAKARAAVESAVWGGERDLLAR